MQGEGDVIRFPERASAPVDFMSFVRLWPQRSGDLTLGNCRPGENHYHHLWIGTGYPAGGGSSMGSM